MLVLDLNAKNSRTGWVTMSQKTPLNKFSLQIELTLSRVSNILLNAGRDLSRKLKPIATAQFCNSIIRHSSM